MPHTVCVFALLFLFISFFEGQNAAPTTVSFCANMNAMISCPKLGRDTYLRILNVVYGRENNDICPTAMTSVTSCISSSAAGQVKSMCDGHISCAFAVTNDVFFEDPCPGTSKYLSITYECLSTFTMTACQGDILSISCSIAGTIIFIEDVTYGRESSGVCPQDPMLNTDCKAPEAIPIVKMKCNGKTACSVLSALGSLGNVDPCDGTTKYLSVDYACVPASSETGCEGSTLNINCLTAGTLIFIRNAIYGRTSYQVCSDNNAGSNTCNLDGILESTKNLCDAQEQCSPTATSTVDPCGGVSKYLAVDYDCVTARTATACEGSTLNINCAVAGTVLLIRHVIYGRKGTTLCPADASLMSNTNCNEEDALGVVQNQCNGRTSCSVISTALGIGDPCPGTTKYLSVTYSCVRDCALFCATCAAGGTCTSCVTGYYLDSTNTCRECRVCGAFEYESVRCGLRNRQCTACPWPCETCSDASTCKSCTCGRYLDSSNKCQVCQSCAADQYEAEACSSSSDRQCSACSTCLPGNFSSTPCSRSANTVCSVCRTCQTNSYESAPCTPSTNRQCSACRTCPTGQYETAPCSPTTDRVCTACRTCATNQYQSSPCTDTTNRVCSACRNCATGQYASTPCSSSNDAVCSACRTCVADQYESTPCTSSTNRQCSACRTCAANQYEPATCTRTTNRQCLACRTCAASQYESAPCTSTSNRQCSDIAGQRCADRTFFNRYQRQCLPWLCSRPMYRDRLFKSACNNYLRI